MKLKKRERFVFDPKYDEYKKSTPLKRVFNHVDTPNQKIRQLLAGGEVELEKENLEEFESLGVQVQPVKKQPKKKVKKEEK